MRAMHMRAQNNNLLMFETICTSDIMDFQRSKHSKNLHIHKFLNLPPFGASEPILNLIFAPLRAHICDLCICELETTID